MEGPLCLIQYTFRHLVGALPQLRSFNGMGSTLYAIVVPPAPEEVTLSGPAVSADGTAGWPGAAQAAAREFFLKALLCKCAGKYANKCCISVLLVVSVDATWHCAALNVPVAEKLSCDYSTPLSCANYLLADAPPAAPGPT